MLKYISWCFNININVIGFKNKNVLLRNDNQLCNHTNCFIPFYVFQNTIVKLLTQSTSNFPPVFIFKIKNKYYLGLKDIPNPLLLEDNLLLKSITVNNITVNQTDIINILRQKLNILNLNLNIQIYSSYKFTNRNNFKYISANCIGTYLSQDSDTTIHIFVTPFLIGSDFFFCQLNNMPHNVTFRPWDIITHRHMTEGINCFKKSRQQEELLNQENCVCDHYNLERFFCPPSNSFQNISKGITKYFLLEHLGTIFFICIKFFSFFM
jgi:hypothetical protein